MKTPPAMSMLGIAVVLCCTWPACAITLRASNSSATVAAAPRRTGILCREPESSKLSDAVDVILEEDGRRSMVFSTLVRDSKGTVIGRGVSGVQSTVQCAPTASHGMKCLPADLDKLVPTCSEVSQSEECRCTARFDEPLKLPYQQQMANEALRLCKIKAQAKQPLRLLMFGLGGGAVPMYIRHQCDSVLIESVESDARVALIAQQLLGFVADSKNKVEIADGEEAAQRHAATNPWPTGLHYDVVLVDCFDGQSSVAPSCRSERFIHALHSLLAPEGQVLHNVMDTDMKQMLPMYQATFGAPLTTKQAVKDGQFLIVARTSARHPKQTPQ